MLWKVLCGCLSGVRFISETMGKAKLSCGVGEKMKGIDKGFG